MAYSKTILLELYNTDITVYSMKQFFNHTSVLINKYDKLV